MNSLEHPPASQHGSDGSAAWFSITNVAIPFVTFALVYAFRSGWTLTTSEALIGFVATVLATAGAVLVYRGPSRLPAGVAAVVMGAFFAACELVTVIGLGTGGACGGDGGTPAAQAGSAAAAFCGHAPETLWSAGMLSVFGIILAGHVLSRSRTVRWPLSLAFLAAGAVFVFLADYAMTLSISAP